MRSSEAIWWLLAYSLTIIPPYAFEKLAEYYYLQHSSVFFIFSGQRFYFDILYLTLLAGIIGYRSRSILTSWFVYLASVASLVVLFYAVCEPTLCYSTGIDGLEPLRMGSFFATAGLAGAYLGHTRRPAASVSPAHKFIAAFSSFYSIAYLPVIFTLAGATIFAPADGAALPVLLAFLAFAVSIALGERSAPRSNLPPIIAVGALLLVGSGISAQYFSQAADSIFTVLTATSVGAVLASLFRLRAPGLSTRFGRSRAPFALAIAFVFITSLVIWPDAVVGQVAWSSNSGSPAAYAYSIPEYAGGFMSSPMVHPAAVRVNVTLPLSDASIAPGGFLAGGIGVHSADCCTDGIDYGYRLDEVVYGNGSRTITGTAWKVCDANAACGGHSWKLLLFYASEPALQSPPGETVQLTLAWQGHSVVWNYTLGSQTYTLGRYLQSDRANTVFNAGWLGPPDNPSPGGAFFFQFGVSKFGPGSGQWSVSLACPSILLNGTWGCIDHAESLQGDQSYWKVLWRWGEPLAGARLQADRATRSLQVSSSNASPPSFETLW